MPGSATDLGELITLAFCQNNTMHRAPLCDDLIVHLIKQAWAILRRAWPSAYHALAVCCTDVKFYDLTVNLRLECRLKLICI